MISHISVVSIDDAHASELVDNNARGPSAEKMVLISQVKSALQRLQQRDAQILSLYYLEELSYAEIGRVLEVSDSRVCQLHARALTRLRAEMNPA